MSEIVIGAIKPDLVNIVWPIVEQHIDMAITESNGELDINKIRNSIINQDMVLLVIYKDGKIIASCTLEKREFNSGKVVVHIATLGGTEIELWADKLDAAICNLALDYGCNELYIIGRKGWEKFLKSKGYSHVHTVLSKKLEV
jgi:hypothetical protein